jgi:hypothetical protein
VAVSSPQRIAPPHAEAPSAAASANTLQPAARIELMTSNVKIAAKLRAELDELKQEQSKRLAAL